MDSMRSLNSSLPSSRPSRVAPPEELLQAFRTAALSVTNLYKSAATSQTTSRQAGYQDALEDLLKFLDRENLGLQDGEGWRVREWATARYDGSNGQHEEDELDKEQDQVDQQTREASHEREEASTPQADSVPRQDSEEESDSLERPGIFNFTANHLSENTMQTDESTTARPVEEPSSSSHNSPIRVEVLNRANRSASKPFQSRHGTRPNRGEFTFTAGTKRKYQFPDFFDISNFNDKHDESGGSGGPKRGRLV